MPSRRTQLREGVILPESDEDLELKELLESLGAYHLREYARDEVTSRRKNRLNIINY